MHGRALPQGSGGFTTQQGAQPQETDAPWVQRRYSGYRSHRSTGLRKNAYTWSLLKNPIYIARQEGVAVKPLPQPKLPPSKEGEQGPTPVSPWQIKGFTWDGADRSSCCKRGRGVLQPLRHSLLLPCQKPLGPADAASTSGATFGCPSRAASQGTAFASKGRVNHSCIQTSGLHIPPSLPCPPEAWLCHAMPCPPRFVSSKCLS